jgi:sugar lactone lactonase YvrE
LGLAANGTLYVADTLANRIAAIPNATFRAGSDDVGKTISTHGALNGPLGLAIVPNGDILTVNANDGNIVETAPLGSQVDCENHRY